MATNYVDQITGSGPSPVPVDPVTGAGETVAYKAPCRLATTGNISLSGLQTVDGEMAAADDRVLVRAQDVSAANGIWIAQAGAWFRARDFDSNRDITKGTRVTVIEGTTLAGKEYAVTSANPIVLGTDNITFAETLSSDAGSSAAAAEAARAAAVVAKDAAVAAQGSASASAGAASTSAGNAATSESNAASSAGTASSAAGTATSAAGAASTSAGNAATSETNAGNAASAAVTARNKAQKWAEEDEDVEVDPGEYSAKHWAAKAQESAGDVTSVNGQTGVVVLSAADVGAAASSHTHALADLGNGSAVSVVGRSANSSGARADIAAGADDRLLARVSGALSFVQLTVGMIADGIITYAKMAAAAIASASELRAGTASKLVDAATVHSAMGWVALTAGSAPAVDHAAGFNRTITHSANATFGAPSNSKPGMPLNIDITPSGFTSSWNSVYKFGSLGAPTITARTIVHFICRDSSTFVYLGTSDPS